MKSGQGQQQSDRQDADPQQSLLSDEIHLLVEEGLNAVYKDLDRAMSSQHQETLTELREIRSQLDHINSKLDDLTSGRIAFTVQASSRQTSDQALQSTGSSEPSPSMNPDQPLNPPAPVVQPSTVGAQADLPSSPPSYLLSRTIETVPELWGEWTVGIGGNPPVQLLEKSYGATWRPSRSERVMFSRRKVIIDEIHARIRSGLAPEAAVQEIELVRSRGRLSLYRLSLYLNKASHKSS
jgi:hypothetical protein